MCWAQPCRSNPSCATRLKATAATVLSRRGATTLHGQCEQHQPVKFSSSAQIMCLVIGTPIFVEIRRKDDFRGRREELQIMRGRARHELLPAAGRHSPTEQRPGKVTRVLRLLGQGPSGQESPDDRREWLEVLWFCRFCSDERRPRTGLRMEMLGCRYSVLLIFNTVGDTTMAMALPPWNCRLLAMLRKT
jgi:hypothetical protein